MNQASSYEEEDFENTHDWVKKKQRFQRRPKTMSDLLGRLMARKGYSQVEAQDELTVAWQQVLDAKYHDKTRVTIIRAGVVEVLVASSALCQQLEFQKKQLVKQLQKRLPTSNIKNLRFKVTNIN